LRLTPKILWAWVSTLGHIPFHLISSREKRSMIKKIDHIGIAVKSIEEALIFYESLGLKMAHTEAESEQRVVVAFMPAGESEVELIEPIEEDGPVAPFLQNRRVVAALHLTC